jgi:hypothetical protein
MSYDLTEVGSGRKSGRALPVVLADCQIVLVDANGATYYQTKHTVGPPTYFSTTGDELGALFSALSADVQLWVERHLEIPDNIYKIGGRPVQLPVQLDFVDKR